MSQLTSSKYARWCSWCGKLIVPGEPHFRQTYEALIRGVWRECYRNMCKHCVVKWVQQKDYVQEWEEIIKEAEKIPEVVHYHNITVEGTKMIAETAYGKVMFITNYIPNVDPDQVFPYPAFLVGFHKLKYKRFDLFPLNKKAYNILAILELTNIEEWRVLDRRRNGEKV